MSPKSCWPAVELEREHVVGPAGEGARGLAHVALGVMADAHREQLEQLAAEVLVRVRLDVLAVVEIDEHRRIFRMPDQQIAQPSRGALAQHLVLPQHHPVVAHLVRRRWRSGRARRASASPRAGAALASMRFAHHRPSRCVSMELAARRVEELVHDRLQPARRRLRAAPSRRAPRRGRGRCAPLRPGSAETDPCPGSQMPDSSNGFRSWVDRLVVHQPVHRLRGRHRGQRSISRGVAPKPARSSRCAARAAFQSEAAIGERSSTHPCGPAPGESLVVADTRSAYTVSGTMRAIAARRRRREPPEEHRPGRHVISKPAAGSARLRV